MKKNIIIASLAVLASAAVLTTFALGGAGKLGGVQVHADPVEYSVTFDESNTSSEVVDAYGEKFIVFTTTTDNGNKVGVVGCYNDEASFTFKGAPFAELSLWNIEDVLEGRAYEFSTITGFAISYSSEEPEEPVAVNFESMDERIYSVKSGEEYKVPSITPFEGPSFMIMEGIVTITSLTIMYSC